MLCTSCLQCHFIWSHMCSVYVCNCNLPPALLKSHACRIRKPYSTVKKPEFPTRDREEREEEWGTWCRLSLKNIIQLYRTHASTLLEHIICKQNIMEACCKKCHWQWSYCWVRSNHSTTLSLTYACMQTHPHTHIQACTCMHASKHTHTHTHTHTDICMHTCTRTHMHAHTHKKKQCTIVHT